MKGSALSALSALIAAVSLAALALVLPGYLATQQQVSRLEKENVVLATTLAALENELAAAVSQRDAALAEIESLWKVVIAEQSAKTHFRDQLTVAQASLATSQAEVARLAAELSTAQAALAAASNGHQASGNAQSASIHLEPTAAFGSLAAVLLVVAGAGIAIRRREAEAAW